MRVDTSARSTRQERFVVMLPKPLKRRLKARAADLDTSMRALLIACLEEELGEDWRSEGDAVPGTQRLFEESE